MKSESPPMPRKKVSLDALPSVKVSRAAPPDEASARSGKIAFNVRSAKDLVKAFRNRERDVLS